MKLFYQYLHQYLKNIESLKKQALPKNLTNSKELLTYIFIP